MEELERIERIKTIWAEYALYLKEKYPAKDGEVWDFECPHHKRIDDILKEK